mmetsp:Transcript_26015/g.43345  ORF Transcript_26015/g.43345 Transcript_26015/m.43345 type:complete len:86 (+) Transcript_26015:238-495(+)
MSPPPRLRSCVLRLPSSQLSGGGINNLFFLNQPYLGGNNNKPPRFKVSIKGRDDCWLCWDASPSSTGEMVSKSSLSHAAGSTTSP